MNEAEVQAEGQLSDEERETLRQCESTIERGKQTFLEVGEALLRIRDGRLYRAQYGTFDEYCHLRWDMSDGYARRIVRAADLTRNLSADESDPMALPATESQARELQKLATPEQQRAAWKEVLSTPGPVTARAVREVVNRFRKGMSARGILTSGVPVEGTITKPALPSGRVEIATENGVRVRVEAATVETPPPDSERVIPGRLWFRLAEIAERAGFSSVFAYLENHTQEGSS